MPDPAAPASDVDKFLWRKLFDHDPRFTTACDKLAAKSYVISVCPDLKVAKVLWTGDDPRSIPEAALAGSVVVKANHGSRWNIMILDGKVDRIELEQRAGEWLRRRYGRSFGEWAYKNARRCVFVEEMLLERGQPIGTEYKFHVSGGRAGYVFVTCRDDRGLERWCCLERDGRPFPKPAAGYDNWIKVEPPAVFDRMRDVAERLAAPFDHMRVDLYEIEGDIFFSELTVYPLSGQGVVNPRLAELRNATWDLRKSWFLGTQQNGWKRIYAAALRRWVEARAA